MCDEVWQKTADWPLPAREALTECPRRLQFSHANGFFRSPQLVSLLSRSGMIRH